MSVTGEWENDLNLSIDGHNWIHVDLCVLAAAQMPTAQRALIADTKAV